MPQGKYFRYGYGIIIILVIIYLMTKVDFLLNPIVIVFKTLFLPFVLAGLFYYLLRPLVHFLVRMKLNLTLSIMTIFIFLLGLVVFVVLEIVPIIQEQLNNLVANLPQTIEEANKQIRNIPWLTKVLNQNQFDLPTKLSEYAASIISNTGYVFNSIMGFISKVVILLSTVPFILYYLLKSGEKVPEFILRRLPSEQREEGHETLREMDSALSAYVQGKIMISILLGILVYIGYAIIGLEYSLILALTAAALNVIPFVGYFIGIIPSIVVAFIHSPGMLLKMVIVVVIAQQIENNFLSPQVMGKKLDVHPLTIILLLITVGAFGGLLGMFLTVPLYVLLKIFASHFYRFYTISKLKKP
ncbi:AI-2E family transporter [Paenibacillus nasutitermitis]|uniref:AI-2E family transporter n=1 Tax=Paenibacillus nasutitermitis TaxID=1652958 RepID=A0A916ZHN5_9BACL|nr:AI-2E family transporter [Paenibacillus nasutitermitis]GGD98461.1 AI-2E family transporter [Paenibacillus nasutitermitis]